MTIKPIETHYKGYRFRSRLEARWAVFFDVLGLQWEYEKEGYDLGEAGWYLPDFWLPELHDRVLNAGMWVEVKPFEPTSEETTKTEVLTAGTCHSSVIVWGMPSIGGMSMDGKHDGWHQLTWHTPLSGTDEADNFVGWDNYMAFHRCDACNSIKLEFDNDYHVCPKCSMDTCVQDDDFFERAANIARAARFEHGENGK
jgi:hypothetical protein